MVPEEEEAARGRETPLSPKCPQRPRAESPVTLAAPSTLGGAKLLELQGGKPALVMPEAPLAKGVVQAGGAVGAEGDRKVVVEGAA
ncbi:hypothetical protein T484DRAFT_1948731 [Baffinella frigidus]|nr:hypothetical protein T484DRAFT_1948731 [Cryptophyta sp. CCMP2293]